MGGGGAGGYRTNYFSETPGGPGTSTEATFTIELSTNYPVQIGVGGVAGPAADKRGFQGGSSIFSTITSVGGAGGGAYINQFQEILRVQPMKVVQVEVAGQVTAPATNKGHGSSAVSPSSSPPHVVQGHNGGDSPDTGNDGTGGGGTGVGQDGQGGDGGWKTIIYHRKLSSVRWWRRRW